MPSKNSDDFKRSRYGRADFLAMSDRYSKLWSVEPLQKYMGDDLKRLTQQRVDRYRRNWEFYLGKHYRNEFTDGERKITLNKCQVFVDKSAAFLIASLWSHATEAGANDAVIPLINNVWDIDNEWEVLAYDMAIMGGVTGDCFVQVTYQQPRLSPEGAVVERGRVRLIVLNSAHVHPEFDPFDKDKMVGCVIQFPVYLTERNAKGETTNRKEVMYTQYITDESIVEYEDETPIALPRPNPLGKINVVHIRNLPVAGAMFGRADLDVIIPLQEELNARTHDVGQIISYHSSPITLVYGARVSTIERGANKVWGGLPKEARVENLEMTSDLPAANNFIKQLNMTMHELAQIPVQSLGGEVQAVSNTSGVALHIQYMPLMEKTKVKRMMYGRGLMKVNELILRWLEVMEGDTPVAPGVTVLQLMDSLPDQLNRYRTEIVWPSPLPKDELIQMQLLTQKIQQGLESRMGALKELGIENIEEKLEEIIDDQVGWNQLQALSTVVPETPAETNIGGIVPGSEKAGGGEEEV